MAADHQHQGSKNSSNQLLEELEALSQSLYQSHASATRRTASLALPRTPAPSVSSVDKKNEEKPSARPLARRMSLSPWRSRPKLDDENEQQRDQTKVSNQKQSRKFDDSVEKKGLWSWKPIRAISHIGMQKLSCLFSVEVVSVQGLPASMNGLRLSVCVRKKETKDGAVHTMPSRVSEGAADFEETMFLRCHVYCSSPGNGKQLKFEPRPFLIYVFAVDAKELDFGRSSVDLSLLIQESIEKSLEGTRVRQWDISFDLLGKAKGGELVLKLGFQIMEKGGGVDIYSQAEGLKLGTSKNFSSSYARKQSKSSFSVPSPRMTSRAEAWSPLQVGAAADFQAIDHLNLDEPGPSAEQKSEEPEPKMEETDLPEFEVVDKGVEVQDKKEEDQMGERKEKSEEKLLSQEIVKEVVHDQVHLNRLTELDSIAQQIKALESMMREENAVKTEVEIESHRLDADEETVTREFLQMLEDEEANQFKLDRPDIDIPSLKLGGEEDSGKADQSKVFLPDLATGVGCVVQTKHGGYLAAMNPLDTAVSRKDTPKLAMQISKPLVLPSHESIRGFELFQMMAAIGLEELSTEVLSSMPMDELMGKTAEQVAFEGIASAIIHGRSKEGASSSAARTISAVKTMATAMSRGRKDRIATGIWNISEDPLTADEILAFSMQKIETMAVEALKIQAEMAEEEPPFDVSAVIGDRRKDQNHPLTSATSLEDFMKKSSLAVADGEPDHNTANITLSVIVQLRDPQQRYEAVGGPMIALVHAAVSDTNVKHGKYEEENRFKLASLHVGGIKVRSGGKRNVWDSEKHRLTAMQWLVAYGLGKAGAKKGKHIISKGEDLLWSISSRVMADMWLKPMRNPDIKFSK
ncbi:protein PLASTID MOVEMENT IMPAIRED 1 [Malania oleifera]|uniref:protein PLASTID MOVEMENT IMPAIRED 1 n=1 Tax=Malania oleifera TaxID=397392 RepID=UPI0025AE5CFC|nr:protein PLASTID MOVEMENT IMPAIRED 1 [Malania oleifera]